MLPESTDPPAGPQQEPRGRGLHHGPRDGPQPGHGPRRERPGLPLPGTLRGRPLHHGGQHWVRRPGPAEPGYAGGARWVGKGPGRLPDGSLPTSSTFPRMFSDCSRAYLEGFLEQPQSACLANAPDLSHLVGGPVCGNLFVERGEQCDCGPPEVRPHPAPAPISRGCHDLCPFRSGRPLHKRGTWGSIGVQSGHREGVAAGHPSGQGRRPVRPGACPSPSAACQGLCRCPRTAGTTAATPPPAS